MTASLMAASAPSEEVRPVKTTLSAIRPGLFGTQGYVKPGFERVGTAFVDNFVHRGELGGACCAFVEGEKVVDLWGHRTLGQFFQDEIATQLGEDVYTRLPKTISNSRLATL